MPWTTPVALSAVIWLWMLDSIFSPFDWFAQLLGIVPPGGHIVFLGQSGLAMDRSSRSRRGGSCRSRR
jgi:ABC-type sugar transport system permease subunit